jgi:hypothetical protein
MPPSKYVWIHTNSKLSDADIKVIDEWVARKPTARSQNSVAISH